MGTDMYNEWTIEGLTPAAGPDTEIAVRHLPGLPATPFVTEAELWRDDFFGAVVDAERDGFDVVVSACTSEAAIRSSCWADSSCRCADLVRQAPCLPRSKRRVPSSFLEAGGLLADRGLGDVGRLRTSGEAAPDGDLHEWPIVTELRHEPVLADDRRTCNRARAPRHPSVHLALAGMAEHMISEELLTERIHGAGLRLTLPRRAICRVLAESEESFLSASMIVERVARTAGHVDASTVYRTLDELARIGLVHLIHLGIGQAGMWHLTINHDHEHLVCETCRKTIEVPKSDFSALYDLLRTKYGFQPNPHHFAFLGSCMDCEPASDHPYPHVSRSGKGADHSG